MTERPGPPNNKPSDEARLGASLAFGNSNSSKPAVKPKPKPGAGNAAVGDNGALAAALSSAAGAGKGRPLVVQNTGGSAGGRGTGRAGRGVGRGSLDGRPPLREQNTGGSAASEVSYNAGGAGTRNLRPRLNQSSPGGAGYLQPLMADQSRSPSFIAATLAASRSASLSPNPTGGRMNQPLSPTPVLVDPRKQSRYASRSPSVRSAESSRFSEEAVLDTRSIPPTGNLIGMFEQNAIKSMQDPEKPKIVKRPETSVLPEESPVKMNPAPARPTTPAPSVNKPKKTPPQPKSPKPKVMQSKGQVVPPAFTPEPVTPRPKETPSTLPPSKPILIPSKPPKLSPPQDDSSSGESFVSASDYRQASYKEPKPSWRAELASQNRRRLTSASLHTLNSSVTVNTLADAIVASSLASSRAVSPSKSLRKDITGANIYPPLPPPPRRTKHHHHNPAHIFHNGKNEMSRTPSPGKLGNGGTGVLRTTMRKVKSKEEIDEGEKRRGRKNLMKKHPNKHHEGDRKRWRDSITERERKRYEAVWASNRGLHTGNAPGAENEVCSLVVKDVYNRSRLSEDVLEEAYALVDRRGIGMLGKEEFVVGLWLVDQRLKGRKLPVRVGESVWTSVGILGSIKVKKMK